MQRHRQLLVVAIAMAVLSLGIGALPAAAAEHDAAGAPAAPGISAGSVPVAPAGAADAPAQKPGSMSADRYTSPACKAPAAGKYACVTVTRPGSIARPTGGASTEAIQPIPLWCNNGGIWGTRTQACEVFQVIYNTYRIVNGVTTQTGSLSSNAWSFSYSSKDLPNWAHQFSIASYTGWGDALRASVTGSARASGSCTRSSSSFPAQPATPFLTLRSGEASFNTTATALGAVGYCTTTWDIVYTNAGYPPSSPPVSRSLDETRCDNAMGAYLQNPRRVGCVVFWYASAVSYSQSRYPSLTRHVSLAQGSGLPGNSFTAPLYRTTNQTIIDTNRNRACGNPPSIPGKSCDEYPLATTTQGLWAGGTLRTFDECNINAPRATGPTGASACMITATENNAQGGIMAGFNYYERVLNGDPFRVLISA
jgi:hypothetical protein